MPNPRVIGASPPSAPFKQRGYAAATLTPGPTTQTLYLPLGDERWWQREVSAEDLAGDVATYAARVVTEWTQAE